MRFNRTAARARARWAGYAACAGVAGALLTGAPPAGAVAGGTVVTGDPASALVRLVVPLSISTSVNDADRELQGFVSAIAPRLGQYVPG